MGTRAGTKTDRGWEMNFEMNKIYNMDCLEFMKQVPDKYFDLVIADHPYGTTKNKWDKVVDLKKWWSETNRTTKEKSAIICFGAQPFTTDLINSNRDNFRYSLVWDKVLPVGFLNANKMPLRSHEDILIFYRKLPYYNPEKTHGHDRKQVKKRSGENNNNYGDFNDAGWYDSTERFPTSIMKFSNGGTRTKIVHPTEKPAELIAYLLRLYAKKYFKVYIPFCGSGVDAEQCISLGIDWVATELDEDYCKIANKRLEAVQGSLF